MFNKIFPVERSSYTKFMLVAVMMVATLFVYSVQRIVKDTLVVSDMGAEAISSIKLFGVLPAAVLIMLIYAKLSDLFNKTTIFHCLNVFFIGYFLLFAFFLYPNKDALHFEFLNAKSTYPYFRFPLIMLENWSYSIYYIFSELWGSVMLALMFWQTSNQVFSVKEAKRLYPLFGFLAQFGMLLSNYIVSTFTNTNQFKDWGESLIYINISVLVAAIVLSSAFFILSNFAVSSDIINAEIKKKKAKIGFIDGLKYVFSSKYIGLIAALVLCYGISINLVEGVWKAQARILYAGSQDYARFMGKLQGYTGLLSMVFMAIGSYVLSIVSWRFAALITPLVIIVSGTLFFIFSIYQDHISSIFTFITVAPLVIAVFSGLAQNVLGKATKYAFFDATKEIAYIPLDESLKSKGKAAADVIGGRLGKSGGAVIQWALLMIPGSSLITLSPFLFFIFFIIMCVWFIAVHLLSIEFQNASSSSENRKV